MAKLLTAHCAGHVRVRAGRAAIEVDRSERPRSGGLHLLLECGRSHHAEVGNALRLFGLALSSFTQFFRDSSQYESLRAQMRFRMVTDAPAAVVREG